MRHGSRSGDLAEEQLRPVFIPKKRLEHANEHGYFAGVTGRIAIWMGLVQSMPQDQSRPVSDSASTIRREQ